MDSSAAPAASPSITQHPRLISPAAAPLPADNTRSNASPPAPAAPNALPPAVWPPLPLRPLPILTPVTLPPFYSPPPPPPPSIPAASPPPLPVPMALPPQSPPTSDLSPPLFPSSALPLPVPSPPSPVTTAPPPTAEPIQAAPVFAPPPPPARLLPQPLQRPSRASPGKPTRQPSPVPNPPPETATVIRFPPTKPSTGGRSETPPPQANLTTAQRTPPAAAPLFSQPNKTVAPFMGNPVPSQHQMGIGVVNRSFPVAVGAQSREQSGPSPKSNAPAWIFGGATVVGVLLVVMLVLLLSRFVLRRKRARSSVRKGYASTDEVRNHILSLPPEAFPLQHEPQVPGASSSFSRGRFTYDGLAEVTNGFSDANLLGEGGFGYVHKGVLPNGREIAVKQLKIGSQQGEREFRAELDIITRVHHKHLVALMGYCVTEAGRYLVYEFVPNNTLEFHLYSAGSGRPLLDWATRMKIAIGSAKGIAYLHEDCSPKIIHRDIKAANILLNFDFDAKVSDFGLAKLFGESNSQVTHVSTRVVGTFGYLAPEYAATGKLTEKSDVYSFGVVLLELITGRPPIKRLDVDKNEGLVDSVRPLINQAIETGNYEAVVDVRLHNNYEHDQMARMIRCAAACVRHTAQLRPQMSKIVRTLEEDAPLTELDDNGASPGDSRPQGSAEMSTFFGVLTMQEYSISKDTDVTSEYGLYPSCSSSEFQQTR